MTRSRWLAWVGSAALVIGALPACLDTEGPCTCTTEFRALGLTVVDAAGVPVNDVVLTRTNLRTGADLRPTVGTWVPGTYVVADDGMRDAFSSPGDSVQVRGDKAGATFTAHVVIAVPAPCRCHVVKLAGPDTVTIGT